MDPADFGFYADNRRVSGLRREEIAELAGISRDYYTRLEQGQAHQMSDQVLHSLAKALRLDSDERAYFYRIARASPEGPRPTQLVPLAPKVLTLLKNWAHVPAYIFDSNLDIVAINKMGDYLNPLYFENGDSIPLAVFTVLRNYPDVQGYKDSARSVVAALRFYGDPGNTRFREVVGELSVIDPLFRQMWSEHEARPLASGSTWITIDGGELVEIPWQTLDVPGGFFMAFRPLEEGTRVHDLFGQVTETKMTGRGIRGPLRGWPAV